METQTTEAGRRLDYAYETRRAWWKGPWAFVALGVIVVGAGGAMVAMRLPKASAASTVHIRYTTVAQGTVSQTVSMSGTLNPADESTLTSSGQKVLSVNVKPGQKVKKGQLIATLDSSNYELQLESAKAQLAQAQAKLAQDEEPQSTTVRGQVQSTSPDPNVIAADQATVDEAQANVNSIQSEIDACTVTSPMAGTVLQVASTSTNSISTSTSGQSGSTNTSGNAQSAADTVAVIANLDASDFEVDANVPQADMASMKTGQAAVISLTAGSADQTYQGTVESLGYTPTPQSQSGVTTYPVVIRVNASQKGETLLPGESASVVVTTKQDKNVLTVPAAAITERGQTVGVYIANANASSQSLANSLSNLTFQPVTVGIDNGNTVEVTSGLHAGQQIAIVTRNAGTISSQTSSGFGGRGGYGVGMGGGFAGGSFAGGQGGFSRGSYGGQSGYAGRQAFGGSGGSGRSSGNQGGFAGSGGQS